MSDLKARPVNVLELRSVRGTGGGPEKTILLGAAMSDPARVRITVCYLHDRRDTVFGIDERAAVAGVDYVEVLERHSFDHGVWSQLKRLMVDRNIDLVHAHDYKTDVLALLLSRAMGVPALSTAHGWTGHSNRERYVYYPLDKFVLARLARVIAVSSEIARELIAHGANPSRITTVLNAIDAAAFQRDPTRRLPARTALGITDEALVIGAVGRLEPQKRFDILLQAFAMIRDEQPRARLVVAGDGSQRATLERQCDALHLGPSVIFTGHVTDVVSLHHALDLFIQSSDYEGTPNAVLEAMAMETPLIATAAGGTAELVVDGVHGRVIATGNAPALAAAIRQALAEGAVTRRMVAAARRRVEGELSFAARVRRVEDICLELVRHA